MRRERIIEAAALLFSRQGYQAVNLNDIGREAGIVGSGIYRHFENKMDILVVLLDRITDRLNADAEEIVEREPDALAGLVTLLSSQIDRTIEDRQVYLVYVQESRHLPEDDYERLRLKQRQYVKVWGELLLKLRPELKPEDARVTIHATISGTHSVLRYHSQLTDRALHDKLLTIGCRTLGLESLLAQRGVRPQELVEARPAAVPGVTVAGNAWRPSGPGVAT